MILSLHIPNVHILCRSTLSIFFLKFTLTHQLNPSLLNYFFPSSSYADSKTAKFKSILFKLQMPEKKSSKFYCLSVSLRIPTDK